jgi:4'-phosphopantetheinyl transferase
LTAGLPDNEYTRYLSWLDPEERSRLDRFVFPKDRLSFALGRALVRSRLPDGGRFQLNAYGRPELSVLPGLPPPRFNISHCAGMVAAAFTTGQDVGLDVEPLDRRCADLTIARSYFAAAESRFIESQPEEEQRAAFLAFWTLKEAYIKARGMGLSIPLAEFSFTLDPLQITFSPEIADNPERWFFWRANPVPSHQVALAAIRGPGEELVVSCDEMPLGNLPTSPRLR